MDAVKPVSVTDGIQRGDPDRAELAGCESEHRGLAHTLINANPPDDVGFEVYSIHRPGEIEQALQLVGVEFGTQGSARVAFYKLAHPIMQPPLPIRSNRRGEDPTTRWLSAGANLWQPIGRSQAAEAGQEECARKLAPEISCPDEEQVRTWLPGGARRADRTASLSGR